MSSSRRDAGDDTEVLFGIINPEPGMMVQAELHCLLVEGCMQTSRFGDEASGAYLDSDEDGTPAWRMRAGLVWTS